MKLATLLLVCSLLLGCLHSGGTARAEKDLRFALLEAFQRENDIPSGRNIRELKDHTLSLELTLRSVHFENNKKRILPLLRLLKQRLEKSDFVVQVERMTEEAGCSKALLSSALECANDVDFDFYEMANGKLNPRYRYSQTVLDERSIFPRRLPYRPRWKAHN